MLLFWLLVSKEGLKEEDLDCVGIPMTKLGLRRKLLALHTLNQFLEGGDEERESDEEEESEEEEESGSEVDSEMESDED